MRARQFVSDPSIHQINSLSSCACASAALALEATIDLEVWMENAPEMLPDDEAWVATETRAADCVFHESSSQPPKEAERFEVDGTVVHFTVK